MLFTLTIGFLLAYILWTVVCLESNVRRAKRMGIPVVRLAVDSHNVLWQVIESHVWAVTDILPIPWLSYPESIRCSRRGWHFHEKARLHARHGPIWALVSGASINVHVSDPDAVRDVLTRRLDFVRLVKNYKVLEFFGPNIATADTKNWPRHRKAVAAPFNDKIMRFVWDETIRQTTAMAAAWSQPDVKHDGVASVQDDVRLALLNVLAATGFRKSYDFGDSKTVQEESSYRAALQTILDNAITLVLIPYKVLVAPVFPKGLRKIGQAGVDFHRYMEQMFEDETQAHKQAKEGSGGITTSLIKALDVFEKDTSSSSSPAKGLSSEEIFGNLFLINFAGHDTAANTLTFALYLLAGEQDVQEWVTEEISQVTKDRRPEDWTYEQLFGKLLRCRAVLYETLRLFPPIMAIPRGTDDRPQVLKVQGRSVTIPPNTGVTLSVLACHTDASVWPDPLKWKPSRWISDGEGKTFIEPPPWTFYPWSEGAQSCPGRKFAEVELVAALAVILQDHRLRAKRHELESLATVSDRLTSTIHDVNMVMLLRMKDADRIRLQCLENEDAALRHWARTRQSAST